MEGRSAPRGSAEEGPGHPSWLQPARSWRTAASRGSGTATKGAQAPAWQQAQEPLPPCPLPALQERKREQTSKEQQPHRTRPGSRPSRGAPNASRPAMIRHPSSYGPVHAPHGMASCLACDGPWPLIGYPHASRARAMASHWIPSRLACDGPWPPIAYAHASRATGHGLPLDTLTPRMRRAMASHCIPSRLA